MKKVFVYGALMASPRIDGRGSAAWVEEHSITFTHRGIVLLEPSFANLSTCPGGRAHGVFVEYSEEEWEQEILHELYTYNIVEVNIHLKDREEQGLALVLKDECRRAERPPSARYARLLKKGAIAHGLPEEVISRYNALGKSGTKLSFYLRVFKKPVFLFSRYIGVRFAMVLVFGLILFLFAGGLSILWWVLRRFF